ncbi:hypothetical protein TNCV_1230761 [Trichonephila clavipes]|nr:hypothetical protein TNCV_1230761 [Trichonephila clavipes]
MTDSIPDKTTVPCKQSDDTNLLTDVKPTVSRHGRLVKKPGKLSGTARNKTRHLQIGVGSAFQEPLRYGCTVYVNSSNIVFWGQQRMDEQTRRRLA